MGFVDELRFSIHHQSERVLKWVFILTLGFFTIAGLVVGGYALYLRSTDPPPKSANDAQIPLTAFAPSMLQAYTCILDGPDKCSQHSKAKRYLAESAPPAGIQYTPRTAKDPGTLTPDGQRQIKVGAQTTPAQWKALAAAITLNRQANPTTVNENTVQKQGKNEVSFRVPADKGSPAVTGTMRFKVSDGEVSMQSVAYTKTGTVADGNQPNGVSAP